MKPVLAIVGRPNVGKSTLFNRLTRSRDAIVANLSGLTRDRQYGEGYVDGLSFIVIDTGGITEDQSGIDSHMAEQSMQAVEEATIVLFVVDARAGVTPADQTLVDRLRIRSKPVCLVVNKIDGMNPDMVLPEFYSLGMGEPFGIAAAHGRGVHYLIQSVLADASGEEPAADAAEGAETTGKPSIKIAAVGRPNVGKSTLINRMLGEDRVVVFDSPGTTRDSVYIPFERRGKDYTLIDTAGVRRRGKVNEAVEKFSVIKTLQAISDTDVAILVLDAKESIVDQDLHLLGYILESGRSLIIALNKWDGMTTEEKYRVKTDIQRRLGFIDFAKIHFISALHGTGVGDLYASIEKAYASSRKTLPTNVLTQVLEDALEEHQPPLVRGRRIKLRYAHMGGSNPPTIVIHGNQTQSVPPTYRRYLENTFRRVMALEGTPVRIEFKTGENPFHGRRNKLTIRQVNKKRRLMSHVKKKEKKKKQKG